MTNYTPAPWAPRTSRKPRTTQQPEADSGNRDLLIGLAILIGIVALVNWIVPFDASSCTGKACRAAFALHTLKYVGIAALWVFVVGVVVAVGCFVAACAYGLVLAVWDVLTGKPKKYHDGFAGAVDEALDSLFATAVWCGVAFLVFCAFVVALGVIL